VRRDTASKYHKSQQPALDASLKTCTGKPQGTKPGEGKKEHIMTGVTGHHGPERQIIYVIARNVPHIGHDAG
jgi:hypothetical protein